MEHDPCGKQNKIWNMLRSRKKPINKTVQVNSVDQETFTHFKTMHKEQFENQEEYGQDEENNPSETNDEDISVTSEEVKTYISKLKNGKSPGTDNIPNELKMKYGGPDIIKEITIFQNIPRTPIE